MDGWLDINSIFTKCRKFFCIHRTENCSDLNDFHLISWDGRRLITGAFKVNNEKIHSYGGSMVLNNKQSLNESDSRVFSPPIYTLMIHVWCG